MKTFEDTEIGQRIRFTREAFLCDTIVNMPVVMRKSYRENGSLVVLECDKSTFYLPAHESRVVEQATSYDKFTIETI